MKFEFTHDTIARTVYDKSSSEAKSRRLVSNMVERELTRFKEKGILLTQDDLDEIRPFEKQIAFSTEELDFIQLSRKMLLRKQRRTRILSITIITILLFALIFSIYAYLNASKAQQKATSSEKKATYQADMFKSTFQYLIEGNATSSLNLALEALKIDPNNYTTREERFEQTFYSAFFQGEEPALSYFYKKLPSIEGTIKAIALSENNQYVTGLLADNRIAIWNISSNDVNYQTLADSIRDWHFTPDKAFIIGLNEKNEAVLWDVSNQETSIIPLQNTNKTIQHIHYAPFTQYFAASTADHRILLWDRTGKTLFSKGKLNEELNPIKQLSFSKDGNYLISLRNLSSDLELDTALFKITPLGSNLGIPFQVTQSDFKSAEFSPTNNAYLILPFNDPPFSRALKQQQSTLVHDGTLRALYNRDQLSLASSFSPKGNYVLTVSSNQRGLIWQYAKGTNQVVRLGDNMNTRGYPFYKAIWLENERKILIHTQDTVVQVFAIRPEDEKVQVPLFAELVGHQVNITDLSSAPDGTRIATLDKAGNILVWIPPFDARLHPNLTQQKLSALHAIPYSAIYAAQEKGKALKVYKETSNELVTSLAGTENTLIDILKMTPDSTYIIGASTQANKVWIWGKSEKGIKEIKVFKLAKKIKDIQISSEGSAVFALLEDGSIYWKSLKQRNNTMQWTPQVRKNFKLLSVAKNYKARQISLLKNALFILTEDSQIALFSIKNRRVQKVLREISKDTEQIFCLENPNRILTANKRGQIQIWTIDKDNNTTLDRAISVFDSPINILSLSDDKTYLVAAALDGRVKVFHAHDLNLIASFQGNRNVPLINAFLDHTNDYIYTLDINQQSRKWTFGVDKAIEKLEQLGIVTN